MKLFAVTFVCLLILSSGCLGGGGDATSTSTSTFASSTSTSTSAPPSSSTSTSTSSASATTSSTLPSVSPGGVVSPWADVVPEIDGVLGGDEWSDAEALSLSPTEWLYVKNNRWHLFMLYEAVDKSKVNPDTTVFFDLDGDGGYNYAYGHKKIFLGIRLFGGGELFCGSTQLVLPIHDCKKPFGYVMEGLEVAHAESETRIVSEVAVPLGGDLPVTNGSAYFWVLYGSPTATCYPESLQCNAEPALAELRLAASSAT